MRIAWLVVLVCFPSGVLAAQSSDIDRYAEYNGQIVKAINLSGYKITKEYVITRELKIAVGQPFELAAMKTSVQNLLNLDIFASVNVTMQAESGGVSVDMVFREMPWIIPYLKFKYNEENGWSVGPTVSSLNLTGRDISLSAYMLFGGTTTWSFVGDWPWITGNHVSLDLSLIHLVRDDTLNEFEETSYQFTPWLGTYLGENGRLQGTISWFQMHSDSTGRTLDPDDTDNLYSVGGAIGWDTRDSWSNPTDGWNSTLTIGKTGDPLPGNGDSWRFVLDGRRYQPVAKRQSLALGTLASFNTGKVGVDYPEYLMYRMGGANSIRGYLLDDLGPILYGQNQLIVTGEYHFLLMPFKQYGVLKWAFRAGLQLAAFADWGTAWNEGQNLGDRGKFGWGVGIRPLVPAIDMVRFDFGVSQEGDVVFNFGINTKFEAQLQRIR
jgi:outer membrane protein insertion porin family